MAKGTKHRSRYKTTKGNARLLKRDAKGRITDNQSEKRTKQLDQKHKSRAERAK